MHTILETHPGPTGSKDILFVLVSGKLTNIHEDSILSH